MARRSTRTKTRRKSGGGVSLDIHGDRELIAALSRIAVGARTKVLRAGMRRGMDLVTAAVRARAPARTGKLKASINTANGKTNSKWKVRVVTRSGAGDFKGETFYAAFVEYGTKKMRPRPFMGPAFDATKGAALAAARRAILDGIENEVWWASFRRTSLGRVYARTGKAYKRAAKSYRRASRRVAKTRKRFAKFSQKLAKRTTRRVAKVRKHAARKFKAVHKQARRFNKNMSFRKKTPRRRIRKSIARKRKR